MSDITIVPAGNDRITICHWSEGGYWEVLDVPHQALEGHDNHELDIWPPVPDVTDGQNWPQGQNVYINDCTLEASPSPSPEPSSTSTETASPSPTDTLPPTGASETVTALLGGALILAGVWMKVKSLGQ